MPANAITDRVEFGDFQTPRKLADMACRVIRRRRFSPASIVEPTCGKGHFLASAIEHFPSARHAVGVEINAEHARQAQSLLNSLPAPGSHKVHVADFFLMDWSKRLGKLPDPMLVVGNPPWVTNAALGSLGSCNLPEKSNFQHLRGLDATTGKSNFDISEWMILRLLDVLLGRDAMLAMLCKTSVARKVLTHAWQSGSALRHAGIHHVNASQHFSASVDACLLVCALPASRKRKTDCSVYDSLGSTRKSATLGYRDGIVISDVASFERWKHLRGSSPYRWRSGIKHDCARVMELAEKGGELANGLGEVVSLEDTYLFPMLKSSELARGKSPTPCRRMLVTQETVGDETSPIAERAPVTWSYLTAHRQLLDGRKSSVYRERPRFSIFGVGSYSFAPWKLAISGFYKSLTFTVVGPHGGKPTVLDDTAYFLPCETRSEARFLQGLLMSAPAQSLLGSFIFWSAKRPITIDVLARLDLAKLAQELQCQRKYDRIVRSNSWIKDLPSERSR